MDQQKMQALLKKGKQLVARPHPPALKRIVNCTNALVMVVNHQMQYFKVFHTNFVVLLIYQSLLNTAQELIISGIQGKVITWPDPLKPLFYFAATFSGLTTAGLFVWAMLMSCRWHMRHNMYSRRVRRENARAESDDADDAESEYDGPSSTHHHLTITNHQGRAILVKWLIWAIYIFFSAQSCMPMACQSYWTDGTPCQTYAGTMGVLSAISLILIVAIAVAIAFYYYNLKITVDTLGDESIYQLPSNDYPTYDGSEVGSLASFGLKYT